MSEALFGLGGLRFWTEEELDLREIFQSRVIKVAKKRLLRLNPSWRFARTEGPILHPRSEISSSYSEEDIFVTNHVGRGEILCLRPETTPSSYAYAKHLGGKLPLCVWQAGISSRRETNDGASAAKLRFNVFWQLELQCIYQVGTKADYRAALIPEVSREIHRLTMCSVRVVEADRLPNYSESTLDIEVFYQNSWREVASCSIRTDFSEDTRVCEIAIGLDRIATIAAKEKVE